MIDSKYVITVSVAIKNITGYSNHIIDSFNTMSTCVGL